MTAPKIILPAIALLLGACQSAPPEPAPVTIVGVLAGGGVECAQLRLDDGEQLSLTGTVPKVPLGTRVRLSGHWAEISYCMQGRTFAVESASQATP